MLLLFWFKHDKYVYFLSFLTALSLSLSLRPALLEDPAEYPNKFYAQPDEELIKMASQDSDLHFKYSNSERKEEFEWAQIINKNSQTLCWKEILVFLKKRP